ncbi:hypothetical protein AU255_09155 [Methyloprofundus sedimenti]|uniref:Uncharacterized protein n=1 Tax=Methyloprofundus sedimenti TaxID=1420851 RepID=A0A1V8M8W9_9GAMM|nr:hypothetical protein [Methyloprofundus sedimenti]OQK18005.1 hypothetical protein AU255_09155 [Methyloprofundus sedimenti]
MPLIIDSKYTIAKNRYIETGDKELIIKLLRSKEPFPDDFRDFVADLLEGKVKMPVGRVKKSSWNKAKEQAFIQCEYEELLGFFKKKGKVLMELQKNKRLNCLQKDIINQRVL